MLTQYPHFKQGISAKIEKSLGSKDKTILEDFLKYCRITAGDKKVLAYKRELLKIRFIVKEDLDKWNKKDKNKNPILIQEYLGLLNNSHLEKWTKNTIKIYLKKFLRWKFKDLTLIEDIKQEKGFNNKRINESTLVTPEEAEILIRTAESLKWKALLSLMLESACRPQEIRLSKWRDLKFNNEGADITFYSGKTKQARTIPIKDCVVHLKRWEKEYSFPQRREDDYVFPNPKDRNNPLSNNILPQTFRRFCEKAGIRRIFPYMFRHTKLTTLYQKLPEQIVKKYAGHSADSSMASIYSHISSKNMKDIVLKEIYQSEEITPEQKQDYEKKIEENKRLIEDLQRVVGMLKGVEVVMMNKPIAVKK